MNIGNIGERRFGSCFSLAWLAALLLATAANGAERSEMELDIPAIRRFMARHGVEPFEVPEAALTQKQADQLSRSRFQSVEIPALLERLGSRDDADQVADWAVAASKLLGSHYDNESSVEALAEGISFYRAGVRDFLVDWLICRLNESYWQKSAFASEKLLRPLSNNQQIVEISPNKAFWVLSGSYALFNRRTEPGAEARQIRALHRLLLDDRLSLEEERALVPAMLTSLRSQARHIEETAEAWLELINDERVEAWIRLTAQGLYEIKIAWSRRGSGYAYTVTEGGWQGFRYHLARAREALVEAWQLNPESPAAPTAMITLIMGGERGDGETIDLWLQRALAGRADYEPAVRNYVWASLPRWGGSHDKMTAFAWACALTDRFDTYLPRRGMENLIRHITTDLSGSPRDYFSRQPMAGEVLVYVCKRYLQQAIDDKDEHQEYAWRSYLAMCLWLAGRDREAFGTLSSIEQPLHSWTRNQLIAFDTNEREMRGNVELAALEMLPQWRIAENARRIGKFAAAEEILKELAQRAKELGRPVPLAVEDAMEALRFDIAMAAGEWYDLRIDEELSHWYNVHGDWKVDDEGGIVLTGNLLVRRPRLIHQWTIDPPLEYRGVVEFLPGTPAPVGVSFLFGHRSSGHKIGNRFNAAVWFYGNQWNGSILRNDSKSSAPYVAIDPPGEREQFLVRVTADGKITFELGERTILEDLKLSEKYSPETPGRLGLGHYTSKDRSVIRFSGLQVRRPSDEPEQAGSEHEDE